MAGNQACVAVYSAIKREQFPSDDRFYKGIVRHAAGETVTVPDLPLILFGKLRLMI